ncbi:hypothetical protein SLS56_006854 [Neofusicoccum ribis]|uniref:EF-hand domain-containing protein n=1 Tax=Neofusicoccum ribis TaxID=45134 RepID=A0ABR3SPP0_9PEZI
MASLLKDSFSIFNKEGSVPRSEYLLPHDASSETDEIDHERFPSSKQRRASSRSSFVLSLLLKFLVIFLAVWGIVDIVVSLWTTTHSNNAPQYPSSSRNGDQQQGQEDRPSCACGNSIAEAKTLHHCTYDTIAAAWLPPHCRDDELAAEFDTVGPEPNGSWPYYTDWDKNGRLTIEEVAALADVGGHFFTTHEWHIAHCTYSWLKQVRAQERGTVIEKRSTTEGHTKHCGMMALKRDALDEVVTGSGVALNADVLH